MSQPKQVIMTQCTRKWQWFKFPNRVWIHSWFHWKNWARFFSICSYHHCDVCLEKAGMSVVGARRQGNTQTTPNLGNRQTCGNNTSRYRGHSLKYSRAMIQSSLIGSKNHVILCRHGNVYRYVIRAEGFAMKRGFGVCRRWSRNLIGSRGFLQHRCHSTTFIRFWSPKHFKINNF